MLIDFLNNNGLVGLNQYNIKYKKHPYENLYVLNYCQLNSPTFNPIVKQSRGTIVEENNGKFNLVAKAFNRFYNIDQEEILKYKFNWSNYIASVKEDGTLILVYKYNDKIYIGTRYGFGDNTYQNSQSSFEELFYSSTNLEEENLDLFFEDFPGHTLVFELCSYKNKIVRHYDETKLYLLSIFNGFDELSHREVIEQSLNYNLPSPSEFFLLNSKEQLEEICIKKNENDKSFEGFVIRDNSNYRMKVKTPSYLMLARFKNNNKPSANDIADIIVAHEQDELIVYMPEYAGILNKTGCKYQTERLAHYDFIDKYLTLPKQHFYEKAKNKGMCFIKHLCSVKDGKIPKESMFEFDKKLLSNIVADWIKNEYYSV